MIVLGSRLTGSLLALVITMGSGMLPTVEALAPPSSTSITTEEPLIIKAPGATCGYIDGRKDQAHVCGDIRQTCALYFPTSAYAKYPAMAPPASSTLPGTTVSATSATVAVDAPKTRGRRLQRRPEPGPAITPSPGPHPVQYGAFACCDSAVPACTLQPTACVDNHLHPASVLCTGRCPNDDMTLKCTADMNWRCKLAQMATPIAYLEKPSYDDDKLRRRKESIHARLATLDQVARGWYCGQLEAHTDILSHTLEVSTLGQYSANTESIATETSSSGETTPSEARSADEVSSATGPADDHRSETQPTETSIDDSCTDEMPQFDSQPAPSVDNPSPPADSSPVDTGTNQNGPPGSTDNEQCEWIDDYGNCCDPTEAIYYRLRRHRGMRRSEMDRGDTEEASITPVSKVQVSTYSHLTTIASRPMATFTPVEAPNMTIIEAIYVVLNTYDNQTDPTPFQEATRSYTILPYTDTLKERSETAKPTRAPRPVRPTTMKGGDPKAGMKAGIAVGAIVVLALVGSVILYRRRLRKARRIRSERDSQPGPTRGWGT